MTTLAWTHEATDGLGPAVSRAYERAGSSTFDGADLRALSLATFGAMADLGPSPTATGAAAVRVQVRRSPDPVRAALQELLAASLAALYGAHGGSVAAAAALDAAPVVRLATVDGAPADTRAGGDAGIVWALVAVKVAEVAVAGIIAAACAWSVAAGLEAVTTAIVSSDKHKALAATLARATEAADAHAELERAKGAPVPLSAADWKRWELLEQATRALSGWKPEPMRSVPDLRAMSAAAAAAVPSSGSIVGAGLALGALYLFSRESRKAQATA